MPRRRDSRAPAPQPGLVVWAQVVHSMGVGSVSTTAEGGTEDAFALGDLPPQCAIRLSQQCISVFATT
jgi:hypothetical protein